LRSGAPALDDLSADARFVVEAAGGQPVPARLALLVVDRQAKSEYFFPTSATDDASSPVPWWPAYVQVDSRATWDARSGQVTMISGTSAIAARITRAHYFAEGEPITLALTVGRDLRIWRSAQRFLVVPW
jgi:hypothetical protein